MNNRNPVKIAALVIAILILAAALAAGFLFPIRENKQEAEPLSAYWSEDSVPAQELRAYVAMVTNPEDKENFIPEKDRIAVFDMDGTLTCETSTPITTR